jgi:hypothetical protein
MLRNTEKDPVFRNRRSLTPEVTPPSSGAQTRKRIEREDPTLGTAPGCCPRKP